MRPPAGRLRLSDVTLELAVALGLAEGVRGALQGFLRRSLILLGAGPRGRVERIGGLRERLGDLWLRRRAGLGRLAQLRGAGERILAFELGGPIGELVEVVRRLLGIALVVGLLVAGRGP